VIVMLGADACGDRSQSPSISIHALTIRMSNERKVPQLGVITSAQTLRTRPMLSGGRNRNIVLNACSKRLGTGKSATTADKKISDGRATKRNGLQRRAQGEMRFEGVIYEGHTF
jgi:hypothetical protein